MEINFSICSKCKTVDYKTIINDLRLKYPEAKFDVRCHSYCGPGSLKPFVAVNETFILGDDTQDLLKKVNEFIRGMEC
ncbi:MAG: DUF1450 domain-containing protein [Bacilli bacterium]